MRNMIVQVEMSLPAGSDCCDSDSHFAPLYPCIYIIILILFPLRSCLLLQLTPLSLKVRETSNKDQRASISYFYILAYKVRSLIIGSRCDPHRAPYLGETFMLLATEPHTTLVPPNPRNSRPHPHPTPPPKPPGGSPHAKINFSGKSLDRHNSYIIFSFFSCPPQTNSFITVLTTHFSFPHISASLLTTLF